MEQIVFASDLGYLCPQVDRYPRVYDAIYHSRISAQEVGLAVSIGWIIPKLKAGGGVVPQALLSQSGGNGIEFQRHVSAKCVEGGRKTFPKLRFASSERFHGTASGKVTDFPAREHRRAAHAADDLARFYSPAWRSSQDGTEFLLYGHSRLKAQGRLGHGGIC
jgi:hypothetical protein